MKKEDYITAMQKINLSDQFAQETITMLQSEEKHHSHNNRKNTENIRFQDTVRNRSFYRVAVIAAILLLSTAGISVAAAKLSVANLFKGYFRQPVKQESNHSGNSQDDQGASLITSIPMKEDNEFLEEASAILHSSVTAHGLKLTARGVVGDRHTICIAVDVETTNGSAFSKSQKGDVTALSFSKVWLKTDDVPIGQYCYVTRVDDGSESGKATFVLQNSLDIGGNSKHISITFTNLNEPDREQLVDLGSGKSLFDIMKEIGEASDDDFDYMGARYTKEEDRSWYHETEKKFLQELKRSGIKSNSTDYDAYWGKRDAYMENAIIKRGGITPKYCIKRTENQATFCTKYPKLAVSNIGIRNGQLCVKFELNASMNFEKFCDSGIVIMNKKNGRILVGSVDASQPVNGNDESQADMVDGKIISCGVQFSGVSDKEALKDYYFAFGGQGYSENTLFEGEWNLDFDLDYSDTTREYAVSAKVKAGNEDRALEKIMISPLSLQLQFVPETDKGSSQDSLDERVGENSKTAEPEKIKIIMKDHIEVVPDNQSSEEDSIRSVLPAIIDLDQVKAIEINGTRVELSAE